MKNISLILFILLLSGKAIATLTPITGTLSLCDGSTTSLSNVTPGGTWACSSLVAVVDASGVVAGVTAGTSVITYTVGTEFTTATVTVYPLPASILGPTHICTGATATLSNPAGGGIWGCSDISVATIGSSTGTVSGITPGTALVSYTAPSGCSRFAEIIVNPLPTISGSSTICVGQALSLSSSTFGVTWSSSSPAIVFFSPTTGFMTGINAGTTVISCVTPAGCAATTVVTVNPGIGPITGSPLICGSSTGSLAHSTPGGMWSSSNPAVAFVNPMTGIVTPISTGTTYITYTVPSGCYSSIIVTVSSAPACTGTPVAGAVTATASCLGSPTLLSLTGASTDCGINYQWQISDNGSIWTNIAGSNSPAYSTTVSAPKYYRNLLTCSFSGLSQASAPLYLNPGFNIASHSVIPAPDTACTSTHFYITACGISSSLSVITYFGDNTSSTTPLTLSGGVYNAHIYHAYSMPGVYAVKHVLYNGSTAIDSVSSSYEHIYCHTLPIKLYFDNNSNCAFDAGERDNTIAVTVRVDSNGIPVDTLSCTSGLYYKAAGAAGTIYAFSLISTPGLSVSCPAGGILYDTIVSYTNTYTTKYFGLHCGGASGHDLSIQTSVRQGIHSHQTTIIVTNMQCYPVAPVIMVTCPRFSLFPSPYWPSTESPAPIISGNTTTWALDPISAGEQRTIIVTSEVPGGMPAWVHLGDTAVTIIKVNPISGDIDSSNNTVIRIDTSKSGFDPNDIAVSPEGYVLPCAQLQYTVRFENDGNDTAHNIYVLDTLSPGLDPSSLEIVSASSAMYTSIIRNGAQNIVKFDFPHIMLPDSSHHGHCMGMFVYRIKAKNALSDGTQITGRAGIYFDDNPVVMTNNAITTIGVNPIDGPVSVCSGGTAVVTDATQGGTWSCSGPISVTSAGMITGSSVGAGIVSYAVANSCAVRYTTKNMDVTTIPTVSAITGGSTICVGSTIGLSDTTPGGIWSCGTGIASVSSSGTVSAIVAGIAIISYTTTNSCGSNTATGMVTIDPMPQAGTITSTASLCAGSVIALSSTSPGGGWLAGGSGIITLSSAGVVTGVAEGTATVSYIVSNGCGSDITSVIVTVNALPVAGTISGTTTLCAGASGTLSSSVAGGIWASSTSGIATVSSIGYISGISAGTSLISYTVTNSCGSAGTGVMLNVEEFPVSATISGMSEICFGAVTTLSSSVAGGVWSSASGTVASVDGSGNVMGLSVGTTTISYSRSNSCGTATTTAPITVITNEVPAVEITASPAGNICSGTAATFTPTASYGGTTPVYQWIKNGVYAASGTIYSYTPENGDMIYCKLASSYACRLADTVPSGTITMTVDSVYVPTVTVSANPGFTIGAGMYDTFTAAASGAGPSPTYQWYINSVAISGATNNIFVSNSLAEGDSVCCFIAGSGACGQVSSQCNVMHITSGVTENGNSTDITVFPNPTNGKLVIKGKVSVNNEPVNIEIVNVLGQVVYKDIAIPQSDRISKQIEFENHLSNGVYMLTVQAAYGRKVFSIILHR